MEIRTVTVWAKSAFFLAALLLFCSTFSSATTLTSKTYSASGNDFAGEVIQTDDDADGAADDGFLIAGSTYAGGSLPDAWLIKTDKSGVVAWEIAYGGAFADYAHDVIQTSDGGYIITGVTNYDGTFAELLLIKTDETGNVVVSE